MQKRNFILLITVILLGLLLAVFYYLSSYKSNTGQNPEGGTNFLSNFNPFGGNKENNNPEEKQGQEESEIPAEISTDKLRKISSVPVAGYITFNKERLKEVVLSENPETTPKPPETEFVPAVRYMSLLGGNTYQTFLDKTDERKFSDTTIPAIYEALFGASGESVIVRYLQSDEVTIATFLGKVPKEVFGEDKSNYDITGSVLAENIKDVSVSPDKLKFMYLAPTEDGGVNGIITNLADEKKSLLFNSPFSEWISQWPNSKMITLTTKASGYVPGHMYSIDPAVKKLTRVFGQINGLTTLTSPNGKLVAYSDSGVNLSIYEIGARSSFSSGVKTLSEKCTWNSASTILYCAVPKSLPTAVYPDGWYKGQVSFTDEIWKIDVVTGTTELLIDTNSASDGEGLDAVKLTLDGTEKYLLWVNKKDSGLWQLELE